MNKAKHTHGLPFVPSKREGEIYDSSGQHVLSLNDFYSDSDKRELIQYIVTACNALPALVGALEEANEIIEALNVMADFEDDPEEPCEELCHHELCQAAGCIEMKMNKIRAALALAKAGA